MYRNFILFSIIIIGLHPLVQGQSLYVKNRIQSDSSDSQKISKQHREIVGFKVAQQIELFGNIKDSLENEITRYTTKRLAKKNKEEIQLFFEQLQDNLIGFQKIQNANSHLFYELDSLFQLLFIAYEEGQLLTKEQYRNYKEGLKISKIYKRYRQHIRQLEGKRKSVFIDVQNASDFFAIRGWQVSAFSELMDYINKGLDDLQKQRLYEIEQQSNERTRKKQAEIKALEATATLQMEEIAHQLNFIERQRFYIDSIARVVQEKNERLTVLSENLNIESITLSKVKEELALTENRFRSLKEQLAFSKRSYNTLYKQNQFLMEDSDSLSIQNQQLIDREHQLTMNLNALKIAGEEQTAINNQLNKDRATIEDWLWVLTAASIIGVILLTFTTNRMNKEKQKVTRAYSELEKTKDLLQLKTEDLNHSHRELNHRIKNNLQQISSLIYLQEEEIEDEQARAAFSALQGRIDTIKIVHQKLYSKKQQQLTMVNMAEYIQDLVRYIVGRDAIIHLSIPAIDIEMDHATDIGLIVNELVTNASKYAFPRTKHPEIWVQVKVEHHQLFLTVKDNGPGFPADFSLDQITSFGLTSIVELFVHKSSKGSLETYNEGGAVVQIAMPFNLKTGKLMA